MNNPRPTPIAIAYAGIERMMKRTPLELAYVVAPIQIAMRYAFLISLSPLFFLSNFQIPRTMRQTIVMMETQ